MNDTANDRPPSLVFLAASRSPHCSLRLDKHLSGYHTMQFMSAQSGGVYVAYDDRAYHLADGQAWFWPAYPGPRLRFAPAPPFAQWFHRHVGFTGSLVSRWASEGLWPDAPQPAPPTRDWDAFWDELITQAQRSDTWGRRRAVNLLEQMLIELAEARTPPAPETLSPWLGPLLERLSAEGKGAEIFAPDYTELARELGMGVSTLRRKFKTAMGGASLHHYVIQNRIARARALLTETDLPLKAVAARLGYDTEYFFARQFRQIVGVAPGVYRKSRQR